MKTTRGTERIPAPARGMSEIIGQVARALEVRRRLVVAMLAAGSCALLLAGCKSGTITGSQQACTSSGGLFADKKVTCTGSVAGVRGEPSLGIIDTGEDLSGTYRLEAIITVGKGTAHVSAEGDGQTGGKVSPDEPLRISAVVGVDEADDEVSVNLKVLGKEVQNLRYEATLLPQD